MFLVYRKPTLLCKWSCLFVLFHKRKFLLDRRLNSLFCCLSCCRFRRWFLVWSWRWLHFPWSPGENHEHCTDTDRLKVKPILMTSRMFRRDSRWTFSRYSFYYSNLLEINNNNLKQIKFCRPPILDTILVIKVLTFSKLV